MSDQDVSRRALEPLGQEAMFVEIGRVLTSSLEPDEVFRRVMEVIGRTFNPQYWSLLLADHAREELTFEIVLGVERERLRGVRLKKGEGIAGEVYASGEPCVVEDVRREPRFSPRIDDLTGFHTRSVVCVPLLDGERRVIGAIELINKIATPGEGPEPGAQRVGTGSMAEGYFTRHDMALLYAIGAFTGIAVEKAFLHRKVAELAMTDTLTGLYSRHFFNEVFQHEAERAARYGYSTCVLLLDIDGMKALNDRHGRETGDRVLCEVAGILRGSLRAADLLARIGDDEFAVLMPQADASAGDTLAARIREHVDAWNAASSVPGLQLSLSVGVHSAGPDRVKGALLEANEKLARARNLWRTAAELTGADQLQRFLREVFDRG